MVRQRGHRRPARRFTRSGPSGRRAHGRADGRGDRFAIGARRAYRAQSLPGLGCRQEVNGCKRHIAVDTTGLLLEVLATPASVQDRDAAPLLYNLRRARRRIRLAWADAGYAGKLQPWAASYLKLTVQIVR